MKHFIKNTLKKLPGLKQGVFLKGVLSGHFYSPIPSVKQIQKREDEIFGTIPRQIPGLDLH
ncbi:MAG TPA: hypothetical protein VE422_18045 [Terriglobia bacterium]|nr:hypothetical protein [Terriglobia bacterium]